MLNKCILAADHSNARGNRFLISQKNKQILTQEGY